MNIDEALQHHEKLNDLLRRRLETLRSLADIEQEIGALWGAMRLPVAEVAQGEKQKALPPVGATGTPGGAPSSMPAPRQSKKRSKKKSSKKSSRSTGDEKSTTQRVLEYFRNDPTAEVRVADVGVPLSIPIKQVQNAFTLLYTSRKIERVSRGVYRLM